MHVLFLCPHSAAKSVIATAMMRNRAERHGWAVTASKAGTEPDDEINPIALVALHTRGLTHSDQPRLVTAADIDAADTVVSFGCAPDELPTTPRWFVDWSDAPDVSVDVDALCEYVEQRLGDLAT